MLNEEVVIDALKAVKYPGYSRDIVSFGLVKEVAAKNGAVSVAMQLTTAHPEIAQQIKYASEQALKALPGVNLVHVEVRLPSGPQTGGAQGQRLERLLARVYDLLGD